MLLFDPETSDAHGIPQASVVTVGVCGNCGMPVIVFENEDDEPIALAHIVPTAIEGLVGDLRASRQYSIKNRY